MHNSDRIFIKRFKMYLFTFMTRGLVTVGFIKNGNCQKKFDTFLQFDVVNLPECNNFFMFVS
jgi:hypothetical protein